LINRVLDERDVLVCWAVAKQYCAGLSLFFPPDADPRLCDAGEAIFTMECASRIPRMTFQVAAPSGSPLASITYRRNGVVEIQPRNDLSAPAMRIASRQRKALPGDIPSEYVLLGGEEPFGRVIKRDQPMPAIAPKGPLGRILQAIRSKMPSKEWVLELDQNAQIADHRPLLAGLLVFHEHTARFRGC
jgi:hypothetical protein